jgi:A/G-specific adenine glycosylase
MGEQDLVEQLLGWFAHHRRDLPWRREPRDPYRVWLAEVMLQQTQVATVIPYYERWLARFPTLEALAAAPLDEVLKLWEGLGYYARARHFHAAARAVMSAHGGRVPHTLPALLALPGVGRYTAGAVASLAFNADAPVLDGNVKRVLSRIYGLRAPKDAALWQLAEALLPSGRAGAFNEALMDLGSLVCLPRAPRCALCPLRERCAAFASGDPEAFPGRTAKKTLPHHRVLSAVIVDPDGRVLLGQRPLGGLLGGLWEFISSDLRADCIADGQSVEQLKQVVAARAGLVIEQAEFEWLGEVRHAFTHLRITRHAWRVMLREREPAKAAPEAYAALRWATPAEVINLALTRSDQKLWQLYQETVAVKRDRDPISVST